jgi:hypothetical protein
LVSRAGGLVAATPFNFHLNVETGTDGVNRRLRATPS